MQLLLCSLYGMQFLVYHIYDCPRISRVLVNKNRHTRTTDPRDQSFCFSAPFPKRKTRGRNPRLHLFKENSTMQTLWVLGPAGTHGHQAALKLMERWPELEGGIRFTSRNQEIFSRLHEQGSGYGLVPLENAQAGLVSEVMRFWLNAESQSSLRFGLHGEVWEPVHHHLLVNRRVESIDQLTRIASHTQALQQCERHLSHWDIQAHAVPSTALAASLVSQDPLTGALASSLAAEIYGLKILEPNVHDSPENATRFGLISPIMNDPTGDDKTSLLFWVKHQPGALASITQLIAEAGANMYAIHSIPLGSREKYAFYIECSGHRLEDRMQILIRAIGERTQRLLVLGSFPRWTD